MLAVDLLIPRYPHLEGAFLHHGRRELAWIPEGPLEDSVSGCLPGGPKETHGRMVAAAGPIRPFVVGPGL